MNTGHSVDATVASVAAKGSAGGSAATVFGWFTANEWMTIIGVVIAVLGFLISVGFQWRRDRREERLNEAQLAALQDKPHA